MVSLEEMSPLAVFRTEGMFFFHFLTAVLPERQQKNLFQCCCWKAGQIPSWHGIDAVLRIWFKSGGPPCHGKVTKV